MFYLNSLQKRKKKRARIPWTGGLDTFATLLERFSSRLDNRSLKSIQLLITGCDWIARWIWQRFKCFH